MAVLKIGCMKEKCRAERLVRRLFGGSRSVIFAKKQWFDSLPAGRRSPQQKLILRTALKINN